MAYKRTTTRSGGTKTKTRSRVRKDGTTVTKTKTKSKGVKSKSRSVVGKKKTTTKKTTAVMPLPDSYGPKTKRTNRIAVGETTTTTSSQSGKAKAKTKVRGKGKVKTRTQGKKGRTTTTTKLLRERGRETYYKNRNSAGVTTGYDDTMYYEKGAKPVTESRSTTPTTRVTKRKGKFGRDIPLPKSNF
jgi:hypothetical protein